MYERVWQGLRIPYKQRVLLLLESHNQADVELVKCLGSRTPFGTENVILSFLQNKELRDSRLDGIAESFGYNRGLYGDFYHRIYLGSYSGDFCADETAETSLKKNRTANNDALFAFINKENIDTVICFGMGSYWNLPGLSLPSEQAGKTLIGKFGRKHNNVEYCNYEAGTSHDFCNVVLSQPIRIFAFGRPDAEAEFSPSQNYVFLKGRPELNHVVSPFNYPEADHLEQLKKTLLAEATKEALKQATWFTDDPTDYKAEKSAERTNKLLTKLQEQCQNSLEQFFRSEIRPCIISTFDRELNRGWEQNVIKQYRAMEHPSQDDLDEFIGKVKNYFHAYHGLINGQEEKDAEFIPVLNHAKGILASSYDAKGYEQKKGLFRTKWVPVFELSPNRRAEFQNIEQQLENLLAKIEGRRAKTLYPAANAGSDGGRRGGVAAEVAASAVVGVAATQALKQTGTYQKMSRNPNAGSYKQQMALNGSGGRVGTKYNPDGRLTVCANCEYWNGARTPNSSRRATAVSCSSSDCSGRCSQKRRDTVANYKCNQFRKWSVLN